MIDYFLKRNFHQKSRKQTSGRLKLQEMTNSSNLWMQLTLLMPMLLRRSILLMRM